MENQKQQSTDQPIEQTNNTKAESSIKKPLSFVNLSNMKPMQEIWNSDSMDKFKDGAIYNGRVVEKLDNGAIIDIGYKSEGFVSKDEFDNWDSIQPNSIVKVSLESSESEVGKTIMSIKKAKFLEGWNSVTSKYQEGSIINGITKSRVRGGIIVSIGSIDAFLPGSQIDIYPVPNIDEMIGKEYKFKIMQINNDRKNIIISRKELLEAERNKKREKSLSEIKINDVRNGTVKNVTDFGVFVDVGGIDGLLHITDISWGRINHPSELFHVGQETEVVILNIDFEKGRLSLGYKQKTENPWETIVEKYPIGSKIKGKIKNITNYGAFVELECGVDGMIHISDISWIKKVNNPSEYFQVDATIEAVVLDINSEKERIALGYKQLQNDPWKDIENIHKVDDIIERNINKITAFGIFVEVVSGIDGLIHISQITNDEINRITPNNIEEQFKIGDTIKSKIIKIDIENRKIGLSIIAIDEELSVSE